MVEDEDQQDVVVVGAGAAGLLAAIRSAERGRRTLLLEKNRKAGVKILISGGTRCNLTHACDARGIVEAFGSGGAFLHSALAALGPDDVIELIEAAGVPTKVEDTGKVFPASDRALDVQRALIDRLRQSGAKLALGEPVEHIERTGGAFRLQTPRRTLRADKVVVTTGGQSYPGCGTTGDGYRWLTAQGHTIVRPRPALVPLTSDDPWVRSLQGVAVADAIVQVVDPATESIGRGNNRRAKKSGGALIERRGSILFTHFGLSGPAVMDVSRAVTASAAPEKLTLVIDLCPSQTAEELDSILRRMSETEGGKLVVTQIAQQVPRRLADAIVIHAGAPEGRRAAELSKTERRAIVQQIKEQQIAIRGSLGFKKAEVTAGGVALEEVDSRTMQSKLVPNLFIAGEILNLDGFIGGYNFQAAFSTGWLAGSSV
ncbi:MAG: NAD(P)/FAD-dependent oxidoreductase [Pirellulales bacterium]